MWCHERRWEENKKNTYEEGVVAKTAGGEAAPTGIFNGGVGAQAKVATGTQCGCANGTLSNGVTR